MTWIREDQADIRVSVEATPYGDSWKEVEGGNLEAADAKTRPGGMGREVSAGGPASRGDVTVRTQMTDVTATWVPILEGMVGWGRMKVGLNWLNPDRSPMGFGPSRVGTLKAVNTPNMGSASEVGLLELILSCDEVAS